MRKAKISKKVALVIRVIMVCIVAVNIFTLFTIRKMNENQFNNSCVHWIERANNESLINAKKKELKKAIDFLESMGLDDNMMSSKNDKEKNYKKWYVSLKEEYEKNDNMNLDDELNSIPLGIENYSKYSTMDYWEVITFLLATILIIDYIKELFDQNGIN